MEQTDIGNAVSTDTELTVVQAEENASISLSADSGSEHSNVSEIPSPTSGEGVAEEAAYEETPSLREAVGDEISDEETPALREGVDDEAIHEASTEETPLSEQKETLETRLEQARREVLSLFVDYKDDEDHANDVGVSFIYDDYHREILEPVFENILRMSENKVKLAYSRLKNTFLSYKDTAQRYDGERELFLKGNKILGLLEITDGELSLYLRLDPKGLDKKEYRFRTVKDKQYGTTPVCVCVGSTVQSVQDGVSLIARVMETEEISKKKFCLPVAYAERYPLNPDAVLRGMEHIPPVDGAYDGEEYEYIVGELSGNLLEELLGQRSIKEKKGKEQVDILRQNADTIKGATALTEPIVYFYNAALNADSTVAYINVQQVLNDKFLGKVLPQQYFAIAEGSERIEELNFLCIKEVAADCNRNPKWKFAVSVSCRLLMKETLLQKLAKLGKTEHDNMILCFDSALLSSLGDIGIGAVQNLRNQGFSILLDNTENATMQLLTNFDIDYLRFDARYYKEGEQKPTAHLQMLTGYAKVQSILTCSVHVTSIKEAKHLLTNGVEIIEGEAVGSPKRVIAVAAKEIRKLPLIGS